MHAQQDVTVVTVSGSMMPLELYVGGGGGGCGQNDIMALC